MMKQVILLVFLIGSNVVANAQVSNISVDPQMPVAGQNFELLIESYVCYPPLESVVAMENNVIRVFTLVDNVCATISPVPPLSSTGVYGVAEISGLSAGSYTFEYYEVRDPADSPAFIDDIQFEVRGNPSPRSVDTTSIPSLLLLISLLLIVSMFWVRKI